MWSLKKKTSGNSDFDKETRSPREACGGLASQRFDVRNFFRSCQRIHPSEVTFLLVFFFQSLYFFSVLMVFVIIVCIWSRWFWRFWSPRLWVEGAESMAWLPPSHKDCTIGGWLLGDHHVWHWLDLGLSLIMICLLHIKYIHYWLHSFWFLYTSEFAIILW